LRDAVGVDAHCHDLRATCLSRLAAQGWTTQKLKLVSGHATSNMLDRYVRMRADQIVDALP
jgi:integrase